MTRTSGQSVPDRRPAIRSPGTRDALSDHDVYLFREGTHARLYRAFGCHLGEVAGQSGASFAVWAPNAGRVSVVGDFNGWVPGKHTLIKRTNGTRSVAIALPPGSVQRFRYLAEGGQWFDDPDADRHTHEGGILHV
jgi:1,4-alpha-glucan branching enzyme